MPPSHSLTIPTSLALLGADRPVDVELTRRRHAGRADVSPDCAHERRVIKRDDMVMVTHTDGDVHPGCACGQGIYHRDTRFLSGLTLRLAGKAPIVLSSSNEHNFFSRQEAMNDEWTLAGGRRVRRETMHLARTRMANESGMRERLEIANFNEFPVPATVSLEFRADFKDLFEVRGLFTRQREGNVLMPRLTADGVELGYVGADGVLRQLAIGFSHAPARLRPCSWLDTHETGVYVEWDVQLGDRGGRWSVEVSARPGLDGRMGEAAHGSMGLERLEGLHTEAHAGQTSFSAAHPGFEAFLRRGALDLTTLGSPTPDGPMPIAGVPWFASPFGRDALIAALQALVLAPEMAEATLRFLARHQGTRVDPFRDEEPGKILHEMRQGELTALGDVPHGPYYGTIDATPLWLILLSETHRWTGDDRFVRELWPNALRALHWIDAYGDPDGRGFVAYARKTERGLANQGWKDSGHAVLTPDGRVPEGPIALFEVQGYVIDAKRRMAELAARLGDPALARRLADEAEALQGRVDAAFWLEAEGHYAMALDGQGRPLPGITSNAGHGLWSGIVPGARVEAVVAALMSPAMFSGWGIRTRSAECPNYNPLSYHNGSVWPHDVAIIARGLGAHGRKAEVATLLTGLFETSRHFEYHRLPELFCGFQRVGSLSRPVPYPVACSPQAWAAGAPLMLITAALGLVPDAANRTLRVVRPWLPAWVGSLTVRALRLGDAEVDLAFSAAEGLTRCRVTDVRGEACVLITD